MVLKYKAITYVLVCVALWALIPVVSKLGQENLDNHQFLFWSSLVSFGSFLIATTIRKQNKTFFTYKHKDWFYIIFLGFLGTYLYYILLYFGYANAQGLEVLVIQYSWPIFIVVLSSFILKEKITGERLLSIVLGFLGVFSVLTKGKIFSIHFDNIAVNVLVILAALSFALFSVLSKKAHYEVYTMITIYFLTATIASFISMMVFSDFSFPASNEIIPVLLNGVLVNGFSYIFWVKALKESNASFVAPFVFLTPILSAVYLILFFKETFLFIYVFGLFAVILSGLLNSVEKKHKV